MKTHSALKFSANPGLTSDLHAAVQVGIDDIGTGRFRSFDTPEALVQHLQRLAADIFAHRKTAPSVCDVPGTQNYANISEFRAFRKWRVASGVEKLLTSGNVPNRRFS